MNRNTTIALVVGALTLLALLAMPLLAFAIGPTAMPMGGWQWGAPMHDGGMGGNLPVWVALFGVLTQVAFFALLGVGTYLLYRAIARDRTDPALEELRRAYARGDIDDDEYDRRRDRLDDGHVRSRTRLDDDN
jgi:putative membrane protein